MLNIGLVDVTGLDLRLESDILLRGWTLDGTLRYSYQKALDHSDSTSLTYGNQIPYIPRHSGGISLEACYGEWAFCWDTSISGGKWSRTANTDDYYIEPWSISDASVSRKIWPPDFKNRAKIPELIVALNMCNVFNTPYQVVQGYPMPGLNALLSVEFNW